MDGIYVRLVEELSNNTQGWDLPYSQLHYGREDAMNRTDQNASVVRRYLATIVGIQISSKNRI